MKTLLIDVETAPALVYTFGFFKQFISPAQVVEPPRMLCFAAKWHGDSQIQFYSEHHSSHQHMVESLHSLLDAADAVVHFNGVSFDEPWARTEMHLAGLKPPSPYRSIDLYQQSKRFYLPSHKLEYVSKRLVPTEGKADNGGFSRWVKCMAGDPDAWRDMRAYNQQDVEVMEPILNELLPWITAIPNAALYADETENIDGQKVVHIAAACPACGSADLERQGYAHTAQSKFQRYRCPKCGKWSKSTHPIARVSIVEAR